MSNRIYEPAPVESVRVNIFNQMYTLRSQSGSEYIRRIARLVDERMHEISAQLTTHDAAKVAVLAALNIADELQTVREQYERERQAWLASAAATPTPPAAESSATKELAEQVAGEAEAARSSEQQQTWFDAIFDAEAPAKLSRERLSSQISAKLQSLRQANESPVELERENGQPAAPTREGER